MRFTRYIIIILVALLFAGTAYSQQGDPLKNEALKQMKSGRYGEAIDLLKKYTSNYPQRADGYHLLAQCYEKRQQLEYAVYFYRLASKLEPGNTKIAQDKDRAERTWRDQIYNKIKGHQREIAINPKNPINYLEIGKCYKNLGEWVKAEEWYDKYLTMEEPSADEVIRYTEINAQTGNLVKGEIILKRFVEKLPNDHRLWSRYGYFTMWLGKTQIAKDAFEKALALRPYFKEAQDGLDQVLGKGYDYTYHDTTAMRNSQKAQQAPQEYAIDKYYRILQVNPNDNNTRLLLVQELLKVDRLEEAYIESTILKNALPNDEKIQTMYKDIVAKREANYKKILDENIAKLDKNPADKDALLKATQYYGYLQQYDVAAQLFQKYLQANPNEADLNIRYQYAKMASQLQDYYVAIEQLDICMQKDPANWQYTLQRGLIAVWMDQENEREQAFNWLSSVKEKQPDNIECLIGLASLETKRKNFPSALEYIEKIKKLNPNHPEVAGLESNFNLMKIRAEEEELFNSLEKGRQMFRAGDCAGALGVYDAFFSKNKGTPMIRKEYADINVCAKNYDVAITTYTELLDAGYDYLIDLERAKAIFEKGDYDKAVTEFQRLIATNNADFAANLFLGDSYAQVKKYDDARDVYDKLMDITKDTAQIKLIEQRISWLPVTGLNAFFETFPSYTLISPSAFYYSDNLDFLYMNGSFSAELGLTDWVSVGATVTKGQLRSQYITNEYNMLRANVFVRPLSYLLIGGSYGSQNFLMPTYSQPYIEAYARVEKTNFYRLQLSYFNQDAAQVLYSPSLVGALVTTDTSSAQTIYYFKRLATRLYKADGYFMMKSGFRVSTAMSYLDIDDGNSGTSFELRVGKLFNIGLLAGYEFNSVVYKRKSIYYFSPLDYESHSLFADWKFYADKVFELSAGGRVGLIPKSNYWLREIYGYFLIKPLDRLSIQLRVGASNTVRDVVGYSSRSISASLFYTL